jgi:hypothetical protein
MDMQARGRPPARRNAAMGSVGRNIFIHGGQLKEWADDSLFSYDTLTHEWSDISAEDGPDARYAHTFVGVAGSRAFMFGGETSLGKTNQLIELDVTVDPPVWTDWTEVCMHACVYLCLRTYLSVAMRVTVNPLL